ncbi:DUF3160 domain-containing protein [Hymenobacter sp. BRD128]|uniref:DUF3160 domain-containing protein n=1 Tax=Hymenobacter sp. BRD128 TaxID=2675878 RepID=UPI0015635361|nr:DUF3160 domain-containing protein [Hymenobacter sp. BRD128]QKG55469.1 DUF3160 domain-containing protein [Hymenobacter sp. BRD128]
MNRRRLLAGLAVLLLVVAGLGYYWARPTTPATKAPVAAPGSPARTTVSAADTTFQLTRLADTTHDNGFGEQVPIVLTEDKKELAHLYQRPDIKEYYAGEGPGGDEPMTAHHAPPPPLNFTQSLAGKSYLDLLLLRNELYARNGYCFMNATVRRFFDAKKWYRPVWNDETWVDGKKVAAAQPIPVPLNKQEAAFAQQIHDQEQRLLAHRVVTQNGYPMLALDFVVNQRQGPFTPAMQQVLARHNFVIVPTREEQLFYGYDQSEYDYTPNFVTTDLVLQLLHKYLNGILSDVEEVRLVPVVTQLMSQGATQAQALARQCQNPQARDAADWAAAYYAIGRNLLTGGRATVAGAYADQVPNEVAHATLAEGSGSTFLQAPGFQYGGLKPRGLYTRTDTTRRYFRAVKWLNTAPVFLDSDAGLLRALALAKALAASPAATQSFQSLTHVLDVLVGDEDNRSLTHLLRLLATDYAGQSLDQLTAPAKLASLRQALLATGTDRIRPKGAGAETRPALLFTAGRYTFDGEILSRLTEVLREPAPKRPFPKGLDVFAAFGDHTAEDVLLNHYQEAAHWPAYPDTLRVVQRQFASYTNWDQNLYTKTMQLLLGLNSPQPDTALPYFARTPAWQRRNLSTALGGWAELKHDLLLYTEQPMGAEGGGPDGGPPEPNHLGYVEPNLPFWERALALLAFQDKTLRQLHVNTPHLDGLNVSLRDLVVKLQKLAQKEVAHQPLTTDEMNDLVHIGAEAEQLLIEILKTAQLPDRERHMGQVADVYSFNDTALEEAVGAADALYVVVPINGTAVLARGAIFSYYEFPSTTRLTDEEWKARLSKQAPPRPTWLRDLIVPVPALNKNSNADYAGSLNLPQGK